MIQWQIVRLSAPTKNPKPCLKVKVNKSHAMFIHSLTFMFNDFDRKILIPYSEDLKITEYGFLRLCVTVDLHAEEVALVLPVQFTLLKNGMSKLQGTTRRNVPTSDTLNKFF